MINVDHGRYSEHEDVFKTNSLAGVPIRQFRHDNVKGYERFVTVGNEVYAHSEHIIFYTLMHYNNNMNCYFNSIHIIYYVKTNVALCIIIIIMHSVM